jgi:hypothetical protein
MTNEQVLELVVKYDEVIVSKLGPHEPLRNQDAATGAQRAGHLRWMLTQIPQFVAVDKMEKAMRWLGFLQGVFWVWELSDIATMKKDNMPKDEAFDKDRV